MEWTLSPVFGSYGLVSLIAIGLLFVWFFVMDMQGLTRVQKWILRIIRLLLILLLMLAILKPGVSWTKQREPEGTIAVLMDKSSSMQLSSGDGKKSRWEQQLEVWNGLWSNRAQLGNQIRLAPFVYDTQLQSLGDVEAATTAPPVLPPKAEGTSTDVGGPLAQLTSSTLPSPLMAVIWMGDGSQTLTPAKTDPQQIAKQFARQDIPLYLIGIGPRGDSDQARDLGVEGVPEQLDAYTKNQIYVRGMLKARGVANRDITIAMKIVGKDGMPRLIEQTVVRPTKSDQAISFQLPLLAPDEGSYELWIEAKPVDGESVLENNRITSYLNVRGGGARVLFIEGEPRTESKFIANALLESPDMQVDRLWIAREPIQKWPIDLSQRLSNGVYDLFILGDLDSDAIGAAGCKLLVDQVQQGAGIITLGGYYAYGAGGWNNTPLADVLPIQMGAAIRQPKNGPIELKNHYEGSVQFVPVAVDRLLQIGEPGTDYSALWKEMKPLTGANRWGGIKNAPGVKVLATGDSGQPLMVNGIAGNGRVMSLAFDSTFQWLRQGKSKEFKQFWRQMALWGLRREAVDEGMQLSMSRRRLLLQQGAEVMMTWSPGSKEVKMPSEVGLQLWKFEPGQQEDQPAKEQLLGEYRLNPRDATSMKLAFDGVKDPGRYEWRSSAVGSKGKTLESRLPFVVIDQSLETLQPLPDWQLMGQLAKLNEAAGGVLVSPEQTADLISRLLERRRQATETAIETFQLGDTTLDSWFVFLAIAGLLILQWGLRKRWGVP